MADSKIYHFDEIAKHKGAKDCWLIISGKFSGKELIYGTMKIREHLVQNPPILDPLASISCCCFGHS